MEILRVFVSYQSLSLKQRRLKKVMYLSIIRFSKTIFTWNKNTYQKTLNLLHVRFFALSEHFSTEQLQMIVDGKLKDGDKVLVECQQIATYTTGEPCSIIKLDNQITYYSFYPIKEEKEYRMFPGSKIGRAHV